MRSLIVILVVIVALVALAGAAAVSREGEAVAAEQRPWLLPEPEADPVLLETCCSCDDVAWNGPDLDTGHVDRPEFEVSEERMVEEVVQLWEMWFDDENAKPTDPRRDRFPEFAEHVVDAVIMYQDQPTDIGGQLPRHRNDHLVMAYTIAKESSVTYDVVGTSHEERGLMQLHGVALAGYSPEKVQHNPKLGVLLGVRWMTAQIPKCHKPGTGALGAEFDEWEDADWIGPLSVYAGGPNGIRRDGRCARFRTMRERMDKVRFYRTRIDAAMEHWGE